MTIKAYRGRIMVEVVSWGKNADDAATNASSIVDWGANGANWVNVTDTGAWPISRATHVEPIGTFRRDPEHDQETDQ